MSKAASSVRAVNFELPRIKESKLVLHNDYDACHNQVMRSLSMSSNWKVIFDCLIEVY